MPANPDKRGAYRSRTGVSVVTKHFAETTCVEAESVQGDRVRFPAVAPAHGAAGSCQAMAVASGLIEPPEAEDPLQQRPHIEHLGSALDKALKEAKSETPGVPHG